MVSPKTDDPGSFSRLELSTDRLSLEEILQSMFERSELSLRKALETLVRRGDLNVPMSAKAIRKEATRLLNILKGSTGNEDRED